MKKSNILLSSFALASVALSTSAIAENTMTGFKLSLSGGYANVSVLSGKLTTLEMDDGAGVTIPASSETLSSKKSGNGGHIGTSFGYGYTFENKLHIGGEYAFSNLFEKISIGDTTGNGNQYLHSFSGILGYEYNIDNDQVVMPFIKAGYSLMHSNMTDINKIIGNYGHGFVVGGGITYSPFKHFFTSLEYNYHHLFYPSNNIKSSGVTVANVNNFVFNAHIVKATIGVKFNIDDLI